MGIIENYNDFDNNVISREKKYIIEHLSRVQRKRYEIFNRHRFDKDIELIKKKRIYPEIGDVFEILTCDKLLLYGLVVNNHLKENCLTIFVFKPNTRLSDIEEGNIENSDLLLGPCHVFEHMWTRGLFFNISRCTNFHKIADYGFYDIFERRFIDDFDNETKIIPKLYRSSGIAGYGGFGSILYEELLLKGFDVPWIDEIVE